MKIPFEYLCYDCKQLRLCADDPDRNTCGNCGSANIKKGKINSITQEEIDKVKKGK